MKNNNFAAEYGKYEELRKSYNLAEKIGNKKTTDTIRSEIRSLMESIDEKGEDYAGMYRDYRNAREHGNEYIDLHDNIWDENVPAVIERLRSFGIDHFTFSSTWSSAVHTAWLFAENGCTLEGLVQIHGTEPEDMIPAYVFRIMD